MRYRRWTLVAVGVLLVILSFLNIRAAAGGLQVIHLLGSEPPTTVFALAEVEPASRPAVLVGHGFAGSQVVMRGFALTLAHAGYTIITWDFDGHGANPQPLADTARGGRSGLVANARSALSTAVAAGLADPGRIAILGHSMGSGVALLYGQEYPNTAATIAVSPVGQPVTPALPRNLLLLAGTGEAGFLENARRLLIEAGGEGGDPQDGDARKLIPIRWANHLTILFSPEAFAASRSWLDGAFGPQAGATVFVDRRMGWYLVGVLGSWLAAAALAGGLPTVHPRVPERLIYRRLGALALGALGATLLIWLSGKVGLRLDSAFGLLVGGYLFLWFAVAGAIALLVMSVAPGRASGRELFAGLVIFAALWVGVGLLGSLVWLPWLLIPARLAVWPLGALLALPWFLAVGETLRGLGWLGQIGGWLAHSLLLVGGVLLALGLDSSLGFLILILPVFPVILLMHCLASAPRRGGWAFALSGALFTSWTILAVFPLG